MINKTKITIKSLNDKDLIAPYELLYPLTKLVYVINLMENFDKRQNPRKRPIQENNSVRFGKLLEPIIVNNFKTIYLKEYNSVFISKINKQSPFWVELIIEVSPVVLNVIDAIIKNNQDDIDEWILKFLKSKGLFTGDSEIDKRNIRALTNAFRRILQFVSLTIEN